MSKDFNDFNYEETANADMQFIFIPNGNDEDDTISNHDKNNSDKDIKEELDMKKHNPFKDIEANNIEFNNNKIGKIKNIPYQSKESDEKIFSLDKITLNTFTSKEKPKELKKINPQRFYFKKYNSKFRPFITEYANNLFRKHWLCGKIQKPRISMLEFNQKKKKKKKDKDKFLSFTMKKMFCFHKRKNKQIIKRILSFIKKFDSNKKYEYVKYFLSLKIGDAILKFEESEKFKEFISDEKIISLDKEIKPDKGFSILEKNAYAKMIKIQSVA